MVQLTFYLPTLIKLGSPKTKKRINIRILKHVASVTPGDILRAQQAMVLAI